MTSCTGYLVIADITGYTAYMTASEQEHASGIIRSLLASMVEQIGDPLHLLRIEGDAVLAYSDRQAFPSGDTFLGICENIYNSFTSRREDIIMNTACRCRACANVQDLDLKIIAHHGTFDVIRIGPMTDISGADVILVHRMAKSDVKEVTGIRSYAMFTDAAAQAMDIDAALVPYSQSVEHFGDVGAKVYDLAAAWQRFREAQERCFIADEDSVASVRRVFAHPRHVVWEALVSPELKKVWMGMLDVTVGRPAGRIGPGSEYHCAHESADFHYRVLDWRPFDYFTTKFAHPAREGIDYTETYAFRDVEGGTELRWAMTACTDAAGREHPEATSEVTTMLDAFWPPVFDALDGLLDRAH